MIVPGSTRTSIQREMALQICRDYNGLPDIRTLTADEIMWFYDGLRPELRKASKPKPSRDQS